MSVEEALKVVRQYIFDRTGRRINTNTRYIASNQRQKLMLQEAFRIAKEYYNGKV